MELIFLEGKNHPADYGSRARSRENDATADDTSDMELSDELDIYLVKIVISWGEDYGAMKNKPIAIDTIREQTKNDTVLQFVKLRIRRKDWDRFKSDPFISPFYPARYELSEIDDQVIQGSNQIVLPEKSQEQTVRLIHNLTHLGQDNTENLMTNRVYFPGYSTKVGNCVLDCPVCKHVNSSRILNQAECHQHRQNVLNA